MNCPYCQREIDGMTGFLELQKFHRHLGKCAKNPNNFAIRAGRMVSVVPKRAQTMMEAMKIRADSGQ